MVAYAKRHDVVLAYHAAREGLGPLSPRSAQSDIAKAKPPPVLARSAEAAP